MSGPVARRGNGPGRGGPARGYAWQSFEPGNAAAVRHGAYATLALGPRVDQLADELRGIVPAYTPSDEPALRLLGLALARLERVETALSDAKPGERQRLRQDALGWANAARRLLNDLGMTPTSRARLGLDISRTGSIVRQVQALHDEAVP